MKQTLAIQFEGQITETPFGVLSIPPVPPLAPAPTQLFIFREDLDYSQWNRVGDHARKSMQAYGNLEFRETDVFSPVGSDRLDMEEMHLNYAGGFTIALALRYPELTEDPAANIPVITTKDYSGSGNTGFLVDLDWEDTPGVMRMRWRMNYLTASTTTPFRLPVLAGDEYLLFFLRWDPVAEAGAVICPSSLTDGGPVYDDDGTSGTSGASDPDAGVRLFARANPSTNPDLVQNSGIAFMSYWPSPLTDAQSLSQHEKLTAWLAAYGVTAI